MWSGGRAQSVALWRRWKARRLIHIESLKWVFKLRFLAHTLLFQVQWRVNTTAPMTLNVCVCVYFCMILTGDRVRGQLLEKTDRGGDQGISQVEDLLQEEGEHFFPFIVSLHCSQRILIPSEEPYFCSRATMSSCLCFRVTGPDITGWTDVFWHTLQLKHSVLFGNVFVFQRKHICIKFTCNFIHLSI